MQTYKTPGVYINEIDAFPMSVVGVDTAIPVFIGSTQKSAKDAQGKDIKAPVLINTLAEYIEKFGKADPKSFTATLSGDGKDNPYKLKSVNPTESKTPIDLYYQMQMFFANGGSTCYVYNTSDEKWSEIEEKLATKDDITMVVLPDSFSDSYGAAIENCALLNRFLILGTGNDKDVFVTDIVEFRKNVGNSDLKHAAAYTPYLNTSLSYVIEDGGISIKDDNGKPIQDITDLSDLKANYTQLYNQILAEVSLIKVSNLSPIGAMAGIYAKTDRDRGVWKAPANFSLNAVNSPVVDITEEDQKSLNVDPTSGKSINAIRHFPGKGNMVWGARTLDGNSNDWRYISVRRTVSYVEQSLDYALQSYVFESNNEMTWLKVTTMIETFLTNLWQQGGLVGASAKDAFFVNLGLGTTMTAQDILEGKMKISIGLAVVHPAEFIELNVTQLLQK